MIRKSLRRPTSSRTRWHAALLAAALLAVPACHDPRPVEALPDDGAEVAILRQYVGGDSHEYRRMQVVVRDAAGWAKLPLVSAPIDFDRETALVVTMGRMLSDRYAVRITRVWREGRLLRVAVAVEQPPKDAPVVLAAPFCVAVIPRCDLAVEGFSMEPGQGAPAGRNPGYRQRDKIPHASKAAGG